LVHATIVILSFSLCLGGAKPARTLAGEAADSAVSSGPPLQEWLILGPIDLNLPDAADATTAGLRRDWLQEAGGEAKAAPLASEALRVEGKDLVWQPHVSSGDIVNLAAALENKDHVTAYAAATIEVPQAETRLAGLGSDDAVRVWLNGELVHENDVRRAAVPDDDMFQLKLQEGTNRLLIKVVNDRGSWGFAFRFIAPEMLAGQLVKAVSTGDADRIEKLVAWGADVNARSPFGLTAVQLAKMRGYDHLAEFLISRGAAPAEPFDPLSVITAMLAEHVSDNGPGMAVLVARDGKVLVSSGRGLANLAHDVPITSATKFRIGSVTKQFTAAAILKLQEQGKLRVTDKLSKFFPDYPRGDEVTIDHLLTHSSGIKSYTSKPDFLKSVTSPTTSEELIESFREDPFDFDPGTRFSYNNSGYFLAGVIIEKVSGQSYGDYLRETFFEPLGMHDTGVHSAAAVVKHEATGYEFEAGDVKKALDWNMSHAGGAGALYSTVEDLMRWNEGVFGGKVLSAESLKAAFTPVKLNSTESPSAPYGYGWFIGDERGLKTISHGGGLHGFMSLATRYVDQNMTVIILHNALPPRPGRSPDELAQFVAEAFLWQEMSPRPRYEVDESVDPKTLAQYTGRFDYQGAVLNVTLDGEQLIAQLTGQQSYPIFPMGKHRFFWKITDAQIEFLIGDAGEVTAARHTQNGRTFVAKRIADEETVKVDPETLDRYVGKYDYTGSGVMTVRRDGNRLWAQLNGQPEFEIFPKSLDTFYWKVVVAEIQFVSGADGKVEKAIHTQSGAKIEVKKIE
jgi:CubicO group peptidase (beta-lactamase class C family)